MTMVKYALHQENVHTVIAIYGSSVWCCVIFASRTHLDNAKISLFFFVEDINLQNYTLQVVEEIFLEQI